MRQPAIYILASKRNGTLYTGVTSNLPARIAQHRSATMPGFTKTVACTLLVFYELADTMPAAITREKQINAGSRTKKLTFIESQNPQWHDLYETIL